MSCTFHSWPRWPGSQAHQQHITPIMGAGPASHDLHHSTLAIPVFIWDLIHLYTFVTYWSQCLNSKVTSFMSKLSNFRKLLCRNRSWYKCSKIVHELVLVMLVRKYIYFMLFPVEFVQKHILVFQHKETILQKRNFISNSVQKGASDKFNKWKYPFIYIFWLPLFKIFLSWTILERQFSRWGVGLGGRNVPVPFCLSMWHSETVVHKTKLVSFFLILERTDSNVSLNYFFGF